MVSNFGQLHVDIYLDMLRTIPNILCLDLIYRKLNCATLAPLDDVYQCICMISDVLVDDGGITGPGLRQEAFARQSISICF